MTERVVAYHEKGRPYPDGWEYDGEMQGHFHGRYEWIKPICAEPHNREVCAEPHSETDDGET